MLDQKQDKKLHHPQLARFYSELTPAIEGECDFSSTGVALYTSDASNYRQIPLGVIYPKSSEDIRQATRLCREYALAVLMRGAGTSQNGQCVNEAVILDCSRYLKRLLAISKEARTATVEPGIICDELKAEAAHYGLTFGPDPATHSRCTLGGMIGNNSCGPHSMLAGKTVENVLELEVLTSEGEQFWVGPTKSDELASIMAGDDARARIYTQLKALVDEHSDEIRQRYPSIKRRVSGYNLDQLLPENGFNVARALVGTEGTCVSVLQAKLKLIDNPACKRLIVLGYDDIYVCGDSVPTLLPFKPIAMEGLDWNIIGGLVERKLKQRELSLLPDGRAWLLVEIAAADNTQLEQRCSEFVQAMQASAQVKSVRQITDPKEILDVWSIREQGASATSMSLDPNQPDPVVGWEDTAVDPHQLGDYLREFQALVNRYGYTTSLYGHFGDGCIHARITFDTRSEQGIVDWRAFSQEIAHLVVKYGGSLSGEHGDGQAKAEFLPIMFGDKLMDAFRQFKAIWDPQKRMNPGKLIDAYPMHENLRYGPDYQRPMLSSTLQFIEDPGGFPRASERCIGMGKCRATQGAMCPSYQASGEERYSTRGRAHLLHEMVRGEVITDQWKNTAIAESLEHCLSCKACKHECPTQVDIAAYKAEFMSQHYKHERRPVHHYAFAYLSNALPYLSKFPTVLNWAQKGITGRIAKNLLGISAEKTLPEFSEQTFAKWVMQEANSHDSNFSWFGKSQGKVAILWADSVNSHYRPTLLISAIKVLDKAGFRVAVARHHFCCGRPLFEYGFLEQARKQLTNILDSFQPQLPKGASIVVLEPSCLSVFQDELKRLFPEDARATDLRQRAMTLTGLLSQHKVKPRKTLRDGVMHLHCHEKASGSLEERQWMHQCFDSLHEPESGCCGMAGSFGMRKQTRQLGETLFSRLLSPAIKNLTESGVIVANGFSCHEQILDHSDKTVLHPVQVLEQCL